MGIQDGRECSTDRHPPPPWPEHWPGGWEDADALARALAKGFADTYRLSRADADDIAQEAMRCFLESLATIKSWRGFLPLVVSSRGHDLLRKRRREKKLAERVAEGMAQSSATASEGESSSDEADENAHRLEILRAKLPLIDDKFGKGTRKMLEYRYEGATWDEAARGVDLKLSTCRDRFRRADAWLQAQVKVARAKEAAHG